MFTIIQFELKLRQSLGSYDQHFLTQCLAEWPGYDAKTKAALVQLLILRKPQDGDKNRIALLILGLRDGVAFNLDAAKKVACSHIVTTHFNDCLHLENDKYPVTLSYALVAFATAEGLNAVLCYESAHAHVLNAAVILATAHEEAPLPLLILDHVKQVFQLFFVESPAQCRTVAVLEAAEKLVAVPAAMIQEIFRLSPDKKMSAVVEWILAYMARTPSVVDTLPRDDAALAIIIKEMTLKKLDGLVAACFLSGNLLFLRVIYQARTEASSDEIGLFFSIKYRELGVCEGVLSGASDFFGRPPSPDVSYGADKKSPSVKAMMREKSEESTVEKIVLPKSPVAFIRKKPTFSEFQQWLQQRTRREGGAAGAASSPSHYRGQARVNHYSRYEVRSPSLLSPSARVKPAALRASVSVTVAEEVTDAVEAIVVERAHWQQFSAPSWLRAGAHCVVHYRGLHWLRPSFADDGSEPSASQITHRVTAHLQRLNQIPVEGVLSPYCREQGESADVLRELSEWYAQLQKHTLPDSHPEAKNYKNLRDYVHTYFSNNLHGFCESLARGDAQLQTRFLRSPHHPFVSFSASDPTHALRYAFGQKVAGDEIRWSQRLRPGYLPENSNVIPTDKNIYQPEYPHVGEIVAIVHTVEQLAKIPHADVWYDYARNAMHTDVRIVGERECTFVGAVACDHILVQQSATWPSFVGEWSARYEETFGITEVEFIAFKQQLDEARRAMVEVDDRAPYKTFKNDLAEKIMLHQSKQLKKSVKTMVCEQYLASLVYIDPTGFLTLTRPSLNWLTFLRFLHENRVVLTAQLKKLSDFPVTGEPDRELKELLSSRYYPAIFSRLRVISSGFRMGCLQLSEDVIAILQSLDTWHQNVPLREKWLAYFSTRKELPVESLSLANLNRAPRRRDPRTDFLPEVVASTMEVEKKFVPVAFMVAQENYRSLTDGDLLSLLIAEAYGDLAEIKSQLLESEEGRLRWIEWLSSYRDVERRGVMHHVAILDDEAFFEMLYFNDKKMRLREKGKGIPTTEPDLSGNIPLHYAARTGNAFLGRMIMDYHPGALPDHENHRGVTPLHEAVSQGNVAFIQLLLERQSDMMLCDNEGRSILDIARSGAIELPPSIGLLYDIIHVLDELLTHGAFLLQGDNPGLVSLSEKMQAYVQAPEIDVSWHAIMVQQVVMRTYDDRNIMYLLCRDACDHALKTMLALGARCSTLRGRYNETSHRVKPFFVAINRYQQDFSRRYPLLTREKYATILQCIADTHTPLDCHFTVDELAQLRKIIESSALRETPVFQQFLAALPDPVLLSSPPLFPSALFKPVKRRRSETATALHEQLNAFITFWEQSQDADLIAGIAASRKAFASEPRSRDFARHIQENGFTQDDTLNDGNCFFRAVLKQLQRGYPAIIARIQALTGTEEVDHTVLRQLAVGALQHGIEAGHFGEFHEEMQRHAEAHSQDRTWADGHIMQVLANVLGITLVLLNSDGNRETIIREGDEGEVYLAYHVGVHFESLTGVPSLALRERVAQPHAAIVQRVTMEEAWVAVSTDDGARARLRVA